MPQVAATFFWLTVGRSFGAEVAHVVLHARTFQCYTRRDVWCLRVQRAVDQFVVRCQTAALGREVVGTEYIAASVHVRLAQGVQV
jgi:hypothetical protein